MAAVFSGYRLTQGSVCFGLGSGFQFDLFSGDFACAFRRSGTRSPCRTGRDHKPCSRGRRSGTAGNGCRCAAGSIGRYRIPGGRGDLGPVAYSRLGRAHPFRRIGRMAHRAPRSRRSPAHLSLGGRGLPRHRRGPWRALESAPAPIACHSFDLRRFDDIPALVTMITLPCGRVCS